MLPLEECLDTFWNAGEGLERFSVSFGQVDVENAVLRILGKAPFNVRRKNISNILEKVYAAASKNALEKALNDGGGNTRTAYRIHRSDLHSRPAGTTYQYDSSTRNARGEVPQSYIL